MDSPAPALEGPDGPPRFSPPADAEPPLPSKWPTVFGVIGIILASFGFVGVCCLLASPLMTPMFINMMQRSGNVSQDQIDALQASMLPLAYVLPAAVIQLAVTVLLMAASIGVLRRREKAVGLLRTWAVLNIILTLVNTPLSMWLQWQAQSQVSSGAQQVSPAFGLAFGACFALALGIGYPAFVLIWLGRRAVRQDVEQWAVLREQVI